MSCSPFTTALRVGPRRRRAGDLWEPPPQPVLADVHELKVDRSEQLSLDEAIVPTPVADLGQFRGGPGP
jgi:hypothetical protein